MDTEAKDDWIDRSNAATLYHLERQGRTSLGVIPFLGAGISLAFNLKDWKGLLTHASPPHLLPNVKERLGENDYEAAAEVLLEGLGPDGFQNVVAASAGDSNIEEFNFRTGVVALLPLLATGPVVTTNFDRVLERAFEANGEPFGSVISGPRPDLIVDALHGNHRVLIKLHGDWQDRVGRTFARSDYDANYGQAQPEKKRGLLEGVEKLLFSSRSLLFIGASLGQDRTVDILKEVHDVYAGIRHFAIMSAPSGPEKFREKEEQLRRLGVLPLWYRVDEDGGHAACVEQLVSGVIERISVKAVREPTPAPTSTTAQPHRPLAAAASAVDMWTGPAPPPGPWDPAAMDAHYSRVVPLLWGGRLTFFLGSAIHSPIRFMAAQFYGELARVFECEALGSEPYAVAQFIADRYGREDLYAQIRALLDRVALAPRPTHELFANWEQFRTAAGGRLPYPTILTTNYDDVLERRLADAGLPYHLFSYQSDGPHCGRFYHRGADDTLRIIERPRNIRSLSDGFVVIKLNGGVDRQRRIPESYVTTKLDFWDLAGRIPEILPAAVRGTLTATRLLFLGHGLVAADVESLVRFAHKDHPGPWSWAVALGKRDGTEYWRQCGVEILDVDVNAYVDALHGHLAAGSGTGAVSKS
jgi:hypothetical protein